MIKAFAIGLALLAMPTLAACGDLVPRGTVGIKFNEYGGNRGVQPEVKQPGRYWLGIGERLYTYQTTTQTIEFCNEEVNQQAFHASQIVFQSSDNAVVSGCIGMNFHAIEDQVPVLFERFQGQSAGDNTPLDTIARTWLRQQLADILNEEAAQHTAFGLLPARGQVLADAETRIKAIAAEAGIFIEGLSWMGPLTYPDNVQRSINATLEAVQEAERARQQLAAAEAEALVTVTNAQAEADAARIIAQAIAANPNIVQYMAVEKWDGHLPQVTGGATPFINLRTGN